MICIYHCISNGICHRPAQRSSWKNGGASRVPQTSWHPDRGAFWATGSHGYIWCFIDTFVWYIPIVIYIYLSINIYIIIYIYILYICIRMYTCRVLYPVVPNMVWWNSHNISPDSAGRNDVQHPGGRHKKRRISVVWAENGATPCNTKKTHEIPVRTWTILRVFKWF